MRVKLWKLINKTFDVSMFRIEVKEKLMKTRIDGHLHSDKKNMFFGT